MSDATGVRAAPIEVAIDNASDWNAIASQIATESGLPTAVTPDLIAAMLGSAIALLYAADAGHQPELLRGTFAEAVIAQRAHTPGALGGATPTSATAHLLGAHMADGHPNLRAHLTVALSGDRDGASAANQFWDLELGGQATVGQAICPNCGAPVAPGALVCAHCESDVRSTVQVPLIVSRLELY